MIKATLSEMISAFFVRIHKRILYRAPQNKKAVSTLRKEVSGSFVSLAGMNCLAVLFDFHVDHQQSSQILLSPGPK